MEGKKKIAKSLMKAEKWKESEFIVAKIIVMDPMNDKHHVIMAKIQCGLKQYDNARNEYLMALKLNTNNLTAYKYIGILYEQHFDDPQKAKKYFKKYVRANPTNDYVWLRLSQIYIQLKQYKKAEIALLNCLEIDVNKASVHYTMGLVQMQQGVNRYERAHNHFRKAVNIKPMVAKYQHYYGLICDKLGYHHAANKSFRMAVKLEKDKN